MACELIINDEIHFRAIFGAFFLNHFVVLQNALAERLKNVGSCRLRSLRERECPMKLHMCVVALLATGGLSKRIEGGEAFDVTSDHARPRRRLGGQQGAGRARQPRRRRPAQV